MEGSGTIEPSLFERNPTILTKSYYHGIKIKAPGLRKERPLKRDDILRKTGTAGQAIIFCLAAAILTNHFLTGSASWSAVLDLFRLPHLNTAAMIVLVVTMFVVVLDLYFVRFFGKCRSVFNLIRGRGGVVFHWQLPADQTKEFREQLREAELSVRSDFLQMVPAVLMEEILFRATLVLVWQDLGSTFGVFFLFLQAVLFSAYHLDPGLQSAGLFRYLVFGQALALLWGILAISLGNIILGGAVHLFTNGVDMVTDWVFYTLARKRLNEDTAT